MKKFLSLALAMTMCLSLAACSNNPDSSKSSASSGSSSGSDSRMFAVEAGSAGEAVAIEKGFEINSVNSQASALMEVQAGTSDAAIIDSLMAGAMVGEGTSYPDLKISDEKLTDGELYGVGCRKGSDLASFINSVMGEAYASGKMEELAKEYGVQNALITQEPSEYEAAAENSDVEYIRSKGTLVVAITEFAPMDYKNDKGEWVGFDADMAKLVAEKLGVEIQFMVIDWDRKLEELDSKNVDVLWNGMTMTDAILENTECSNAYCNNTQVIVTK